MRKLLERAMWVLAAIVALIHGTPAWATAAGSVILTINPPALTVGLGEEFSVVIQAQAGSQQVDGASAYINFDPSVLQVVSVTAGSSLPIPIQNRFNNIAGTVDYSAGAFSNFPTGTFTLATVKLTSIATSPGTALTFGSSLPRQSDVTFEGASVLGNTQGGTVIVVACTSCGDVNGDGAVGAVDALLIAQHAIGLLPSLPCQAQSDVNGSGGVDIVDALFVWQRTAGLRASLPCAPPP